MGKKKKPVRKSRKDAAQVALSVVEKATAGPLVKVQSELDISPGPVSMKGQREGDVHERQARRSPTGVYWAADGGDTSPGWSRRPGSQTAQIPLTSLWLSPIDVAEAMVLMRNKRASNALRPTPGSPTLPVPFPGVLLEHSARCALEKARC